MRAPLLAFSLLLTTAGCYLDHGRGGPAARDAGTRVLDAATASEPDAAVDTPEVGDRELGFVLLDDTMPPRAGHAAAIDEARRRVLVVGAEASDVWELALDAVLPSWRRVEAVGEAPLMRGPIVAFDRLRDRLVVVETGDDGAVTHALVFGAARPRWERLATTGEAPRFADRPAGALDTARGRIVVLGGGVDPEPFALSLETLRWERLAGPPPPSDAYFLLHRVVYDAARDRMLVVGARGSRRATLALSLGGVPSWSSIASAGPLGFGMSAYVDTVADRLVAIDRELPRVHVLPLADAAPTWQRIESEGATPVARGSHAIAVDEASARAIVIGGTQEGVGRGVWTNETLAVPLGALRFLPVVSDVRDFGASVGPSAAYDAVLDRIVVVSADAPYLEPATLVRDRDGGGPWRVLEDTDTPSVIWTPALADPARERIVVFGGHDSLETDRTWELRGRIWSPLETTGEPPAARAGHAMVLDPRGERALVLLGASRISYPPTTEHHDDVWSLDLETSRWERVAVDGARPAPRWGHVAAVDRERRRVLVLGGRDGDRSFDDLWALELGGARPRWRAIAARGLPSSPAALSIGLHWDDERERLIAFVQDQPDGALAAYALDVDRDESWRPFCAHGLRIRATASLLTTTPSGPVFVGPSSGALYRFATATPLCDPTGP